jgi:biopolymer transport protein ExbD
VTKETYELDLVYASNTKIHLNLLKSGKRIKSFEAKSEDYVGLMNQVSQILGADIAKIASKIESATVTPKSDVNYGQLVGALDVLRTHEIFNIGVVSGKGK